MKKALLFLSAFMALYIAKAQVKEGKIIYSSVQTINIAGFSMGPGGPGGGMRNSNAQPRKIERKYELNFADNKMALTSIPQPQQQNAPPPPGMEGVVVTGVRVGFGGMGNMGNDDVVYCDFNEGKKVEYKETPDKFLLITEDIQKNGGWKLLPETKTILDYNCRKATRVVYGTKPSATFVDGVFKMETVPDTTTSVVWFTMDIPVPIGTQSQGQLPGAILELDINNGSTVITAQEILKAPDEKKLKAPTKGKKITREEYNEEIKKAMNAGGGGPRQMIIRQ